MDFSQFHPYVYYATQYDFSKGQSSNQRLCHSSSLYLISEGKGTLHTCGRSFETTAGSLVFIPAGQAHDWIADAQDPMVHVCCYFDWTYLDRQPIFESQYLQLCYNPEDLQPAFVGPVFPYPIPEHTKVESIRIWIDLFETFYTNNEYVSERTFFRSLKTQSHFQLFIAYFLNHVVQGDKIPEPRMNKLLDKLEQDLIHGGLMPLTHYYQELGISRGYFFELFKKTTGLSPVQYINHFRLSRAKDDLRHTQLSITEIAEKHHFASVHYFSRLFHQLSGQTPREYRQSMRRMLPMNASIKQYN
jgi:AraC-like DNA-binding protein